MLTRTATIYFCNRGFDVWHSVLTITFPIPQSAVLLCYIGKIFIYLFVSSPLMDSDDHFYLTGSLTAYGNDGLHLNLDINNGVNFSIPDSIADALYYASDQLPVYLDVVVFKNTTEINQLAERTPVEFSLGQNYPNPFNAETSIE